MMNTFISFPTKHIFRHSKEGMRARNDTPHWESIYAAIDLGTSNCRLLITGVNEWGDIEDIERFSHIVQLGQDLCFTGHISEEAMERTLNTLFLCARKLQSYSLNGLRCVTTEACRQAKNASYLIERAQKESYLNLEIISHQEEAALAFSGCSPLLVHCNGSVLLIDIGGGSTELIWAEVTAEKGYIIKDSVSLPCGVMSMAQMWNGASPVEKDYQAMIDYTKEKLLSFKARLTANNFDASPLHVISTSGTLTSLVALHLGLSRYDRSKVDGYTISTRSIHNVIHSLRQTTLNTRIQNPIIGSERAGLMIPGCAILDAFLSLWPIHSITVADRGVREGIIYALYENALVKA